MSGNHRKCSVKRLSIKSDVSGQLCTPQTDADEHSDTCSGDGELDKGFLPGNADESLKSMARFT